LKADLLSEKEIKFERQEKSNTIFLPIPVFGQREIKLPKMMSRLLKLRALQY
jgi:hypothetical protein